MRNWQCRPSANQADRVDSSGVEPVVQAIVLLVARVAATLLRVGLGVPVARAGRADLAVGSDLHLNLSPRNR